MWWFIKKIEENDKEIIYSYGYESKDLTGSFSIAKNLSLINIFEYAKNDDEDTFAELFRQPLLSTIRSLGFVESYQIAIG